MSIGCRSLSVIAVLAVAGTAFGVDITRPGDFIVGSSENYPLGEPPSAAIDNTAATKYLNFDELNTGFTVMPTGKGIVRALTIITANDAPPRDPTSFILEGSDDGVTVVEIASGELQPLIDRFSLASSELFDNDTTYLEYRVTFPTVRDAGGANSMQVGEVQLATAIDITSPEDPVFVTYSEGASSPPGQGADHLFDDRLGMKFDVLNGDLGPTIVDVIPLAGSSVVTGMAYLSANDDIAFPGRTPQSIMLEGSNDGVNFTFLTEVFPAQANNNFEDQEWDIENSTAFTQYRLTFGIPYFDVDMQIGDMQLFGTASTAAPENDLCENAAEISAGTVSGTTNMATGTDITGCGNADSADVWYRYTAPSSGLVEVNTSASTRDTTLAVYTTCNGAAIACDDNGSFAQSLIRFDAVAGQSYLIRVALTNDEMGAFRLTLLEDVESHTDTQVQLTYNFNGMTHTGEEGDPDAVSGYRSISDRGLIVDDSPDSIGVGTIIGNTGITYSVEQKAGVLDIVHLGDRNTTDNGNWAFDLKPDGDNIGIQPDWLPNSDQSGPQTSDVTSQGITFTADTRLGVLYQVSNGGGFFDFTLTFTDQTSVTVMLEGPDWFFDQSPNEPSFGVEAQAQLGVFRGSENVDLATVGASLNVVESILSTQRFIDDGFGDFTGKQLESITASGRTNFIAGYAILAVTVRDADVKEGCAADFNNDDVVNSQDFFDFLTAFFGQLPNADFNNDDVINSQDFFDFLTAFFAGC